MRIARAHASDVEIYAHAYDTESKHAAVSRSHRGLKNVCGCCRFCQLKRELHKQVEPFRFEKFHSNSRTEYCPVHTIGGDIRARRFDHGGRRACQRDRQSTICALSQTLVGRYYRSAFSSFSSSVTASALRIARHSRRINERAARDLATISVNSRASARIHARNTCTGRVKSSARSPEDRLLHRALFTPVHARSDRRRE